jgi:GT2 family glycosyltransferase/glycosyltransferase involved in cell wall biosynthesis
VPTYLFVSYSGGSGGAERILLDLAPALDGEVFLACPEGSLAFRARALGLRVVPLRERRLNVRTSPRDRVLAPLRLVAHGREARRLIAEIDPDLVVSWGMRTALATIGAGRSRVPLVFQHNDLLPPGLAGRLVRAAARRASLVIALSGTIADDLALGEQKVVVVHPGVDVSGAGSHPRKPREPEVLVLGALVGWKAPELAIEVLAVARRSEPGLRLRLVGAPVSADDPTPERLRRRSAELGVAAATELPGPSADPAADLDRATCLLHCAPREPFGMVVLEAMAAAKPVVVPSSGGPAEIVDGTCALLYPPDDAAAAAAAIVELVRDPDRAAAMGAAGARRARSSFSLDDARRRYAEALRPWVRAGHPEPPGRIALVTVTHNSELELERLLRSIERWLPEAEMIVVDNASSDRTLEVARRGPAVRTIELGENLGFGRACNLGVAEVESEVTLLLNPDVELLDTSTSTLRRALFEPGGQDRILAPLVLRPDGRREDSVHAVPGSPRDLAIAMASPTALPRRLALPLAPWRADHPRRVGWAVGCALAARTDTLRRLGPFDETIFMYGEDLELGLRADRAGVETWFWPQVRVLHHGAHSSRRVYGGEPFTLLAAARRDVVTRRLGRRRAALDSAAQAATFVSRIAVKRALGRSARREWRQLRALASSRPR